VLALAVLAGALAGCGGGASGETSTTPSSTTRSTTSTTEASTTQASTTGTGGGTHYLPKALGSKQAVGTAVEAVLTSGHPGACSRYVTERYLHVAYGGRQGCIQAQAPGSAATSLRSLRIEQEATQGTLVIALAVPDGGPYDGTKVRVRLFFQSDHYKVDHLDAHVPVGP
jgi:hypothetical protein